MIHFDLLSVFSEAVNEYKKKNYEEAKLLFQSIVDEIDNSEIETEKWGDLKLYSDSESYLNSIDYYLGEGYEIENKKPTNPSWEMSLLNNNFLGILLCRIGILRYDKRILEKHDEYVCNCCKYHSRNKK